MSLNHIVTGSVAAIPDRLDATFNNLDILGSLVITGGLDVTGPINTDTSFDLDNVPWIYKPGGNNTNTQLGHVSANSITTGLFDTCIGEASGSNVTTGSNNTFLGAGAGIAITTGSANTALGRAALSTLTIGDEAVAVGSHAMAGATVSLCNTAIGTDSLRNCSGSGNTCVGCLTMSQTAESTPGNNNTMIGCRAGRAITTSSDNVGVGLDALSSINAGSLNNVAIGSAAMQNSVGGVAVDSNICIGTNAGKEIVANANICIGTNVGIAMTSGSLNTFIGYGSAANGVVSGSSNVALGVSSLSVLTSGSNNTAIGRDSGINLTSGSDNIFLGRGANCDVGAASSRLVIGQLENKVDNSFCLSSSLVRSGLPSNSLLGYVTASSEVVRTNTLLSDFDIVGDLNLLNSGVGTDCCVIEFKKDTEQSIPADLTPLGALTFNGWNGTDYVPGANIHSVTEGTPSATSMPASLQFSTTPVGTIVPVQRLVIHQDGKANFQQPIQTPGVIHPGTLTATAAYPSPIDAGALRCGYVTITNLDDLTAGSGVNVVINSTSITASSVGIVQMMGTTASVNSNPQINGITWNNGYVTILVVNQGIITTGVLSTGAAWSANFAFVLFN